MSYKKRATRRPRRRAVRKPRRTGKPSRAQVAKACYKTDILQLPPNTLREIYASGLSTASERIKAIGSCYQDYRITGVKVKFMPVYNAMGGVPGSAYLSQLLTKVMDIPALPTTTEHYLDQLDPQTHEVIQKDVNISFKPKVDMLADQDGAGTAIGVMIKASPWLSTNGNACAGGAWVPDTTFHFGLLCLNTAGAGFSTNPINYQCEVFYEFRKPQVFLSASNAGPQLVSDRHAL